MRAERFRCAVRPYPARPSQQIASPGGTQQDVEPPRGYWQERAPLIVFGARNAAGKCFEG